MICRCPRPKWTPASRRCRQRPTRRPGRADSLGGVVRKPSRWPNWTYRSWFGRNYRIRRTRWRTPRNVPVGGRSFWRWCPDSAFPEIWVPRRSRNWPRFGSWRSYPSGPTNLLEGGNVQYPNSGDGVNEPWENDVPVQYGVCAGSESRSKRFWGNFENGGNFLWSLVSLLEILRNLRWNLMKNLKKTLCT